MPSVIHAAVIVLCILFAAGAVSADGAPAEGEKKYCLSCHAKTDGVKKFPDGGHVSTYVDAAAFAGSVHHTLSCTACHPAFSLQRHPDGTFRSRAEYRAAQSRRCRECHSDRTIRSRSIHEGMFSKEKTGGSVNCVNCHGAHAITRVSAGAVSAAEEQSCMKCHHRDGMMVFASGETVPVVVNIAELKGSSHRNVSCRECHRGFSGDEHPRRRFRSEREYRLSSSEICRRCHSDKYAKTAEGIHFAMISVGRLDAPTCVDCHGSHAVSQPGKDRLSVVRKCEGCHKSVYKVYASSVHGKGLFAEAARDVPICTDCHSSHSIKNPATPDFHDEIPSRCGACHSNEAIMRKYGLSAKVVRTYLSDFHGVTLGLYRKEAQKRYRPYPAMAVCTDCHGTHDIGRSSKDAAKAMKGRLLARCQTCHPDATENFPDAWLSHYEPSLSVAPWVFITDRFYGILLPLIVIGLVFQVILDVWRHFRKR